MATERYYSCKCEELTYPANLFDALLDFSKAAPSCKKCGRKELHVVFHFGLEGGNPDCKVLAVYIPRRLGSWRRKDHAKVTFVPFLVILKNDDGAKTCWLPYWHVVERKGKRERKYGQWAPYVNQTEFVSLLEKARKAGHLL